MDGLPKDYSSLVCEENGSFPRIQHQIQHPNIPLPPLPDQMKSTNHHIMISRHHHQNHHLNQNQSQSKIPHDLPPPILPPARNSLKLLDSFKQQFATSNNINNNNNISINNNNNNSKIDNINNNENNNNIKSALPYAKPLDGSSAAPKHREARKEDLIKMMQEVANKLEVHKKQYIENFTKGTLEAHYNDTITKRRNPILNHRNQLPPQLHHNQQQQHHHHHSTHDRKSSSSSSSHEKLNYTVLIQYSGEEDRYLVKVGQNNLKSIKEKMPIKGQFRYFFRTSSSQVGTYDEVENDHMSVPCNDQNQIFCKVFSLMPSGPPPPPPPARRRL